MRIFPPSLTIEDDEGFAPGKDIFGRAGLGDGLTNLVSRVTEPMVVAVDGQWGSGKTIFLTMWAGELRKKGFPVVYFDAFENDYAEDAFTAIAGEMIALTEERRKAQTSKAKTFVDKAMRAGRVVVRSGLKIGVKAATMGAIGASEIAELEGVADDIAGEASSLTDSYLGELLTKSKQHKDAIRDFRNALSELPAFLTEKLEGGEANNETRPLVFIIDELDRCRPLFALQILERVKHFFMVPNIHFVLGVHLGQLQNSVVAAYGPNIDAQTYLQKFVHLTCHLTESAQHPGERVTSKFIDHLIRTMAFKPEDRSDLDGAVEIIGVVAENRSLSLRAIERIMTSLALAMAVTTQRTLRPGPIIGGLCVLKTVEPDLYRKAKEGRLAYEEVRDALGLELESEDRFVNMTPHAEWWQYCTAEDISPEVKQRFAEILFRYSIRNRKRILPLMVQHVTDQLTLQN